MRHVVRVADLSAREVDDILARAQVARKAIGASGPTVVALLFLAPSTRTRFGFATAVARMGGHALSVSELRFTGHDLPPESLADTLGVISGTSDVVVCRPTPGVDLSSVVTAARCPLVNGGDAREHPTQALIDRFAIETIVGPMSDLQIGISGDLTSRSVRSLLQLFRYSPPRTLSLFAPRGRGAEEVPVELADRTRQAEDPDFSGLDVLLLPGLAPDEPRVHLGEGHHLRWGLSPSSAETLPAEAVVLSPGPVIDEIDPRCFNDPRIRVLEQADLGVALRVGLLQWLFDAGAP